MRQCFAYTSLATLLRITGVEVLGTEHMDMLQDRLRAKWNNKLPTNAATPVSPSEVWAILA
jgi:hypothetical protein